MSGRYVETAELIRALSEQFISTSTDPGQKTSTDGGQRSSLQDFRSIDIGRALYGLQHMNAVSITKEKSLDEQQRGYLNTLLDLLARKIETSPDNLRERDIGDALYGFKSAWVFSSYTSLLSYYPTYYDGDCTNRTVSLHSF